MTEIWQIFIAIKQCKHLRRITCTGSCKCPYWILVETYCNETQPKLSDGIYWLLHVSVRFSVPPGMSCLTSAAGCVMVSIWTILVPSIFACTNQSRRRQWWRIDSRGSHVNRHCSKMSWQKSATWNSSGWRASALTIKCIRQSFGGFSLHKRVTDGSRK